MSGSSLNENDENECPKENHPHPVTQENRNKGRALKLDTNVALSPQFQSVSMLPTPLIPSSPNAAFMNPDYQYNNSPATSSSSSRVLSASLVPDSVCSLLSPSSGRMHQNMLPSMGNYSTINEGFRVARNKHTDHNSNALPSSLNRGNSIIVAKRNDRPKAQLSRSASVGGPQRQPSTVLHREPKAVGSVEEQLPEEVYVASGPSGTKTAWTRVKFVGKGSFSEVVLSRPAIEFVKPEYADEVEALANSQLGRIEQESLVNEEKSSTTTTGGQVSNNINDAEKPSVLVAVKITSLTRNKTQSQLEYFKRDVDIMSNIPHHPSLMQMIGSSLDQDIHMRAIFVLPYCPGGDLFDLVAKHRSKLSSLLIRRIFADICSAVVFLHNHNIVHRDIKLENVLLDVHVSMLLSMEKPDTFNRPLAVLTDLGLARRIEPEDPMLITRCGSDDYVPPEIMLGQPYDGRETDSWALGVLLYAMLEGRLPFDAPPHTAQYEGNRARLKTAHRIARVDWNWYKRKDETNPEWTGGMEVVDASLKRRSHRQLACNTINMPWVSDARPSDVNDYRDVEELWRLFVQ